MSQQPSEATLNPEVRERFLQGALDTVREERDRQDARWGIQHHSYVQWFAIMSEEVGEAVKEINETHFYGPGPTEHLRAELVQVAAIAVAMIEQIDRDAAGITTHLESD